MTLASSCFPTWNRETLWGTTFFKLILTDSGPAGNWHPHHQWVSLCSQSLTAPSKENTDGRYWPALLAPAVWELALGPAQQPRCQVGQKLSSKKHRAMQISSARCIEETLDSSCCLIAPTVLTQLTGRVCASCPALLPADPAAVRRSCCTVCEAQGAAGGSASAVSMMNSTWTGSVLCLGLGRKRRRLAASTVVQGISSSTIRSFRDSRPKLGSWPDSRLGKADLADFACRRPSVGFVNILAHSRS